VSERIQIDWLDYWFKPRIIVVGYNDFIACVRDLESQRAKIFSVDVLKKTGEYKITYVAENERMASES